MVCREDDSPLSKSRKPGHRRRRHVVGPKPVDDDHQVSSRRGRLRAKLPSCGRQQRNTGCRQHETRVPVSHLPSPLCCPPCRSRIVYEFVTANLLYWARGFGTVTQASNLEADMLHPLPRGERGDLIAALSLVALLAAAMVMAARTFFF